MKSIGFVFPVFNEAGNVSELYRRIVDVTAKLEGEYEFSFMFVDDGSSDDTWSQLKVIQSEDTRVSCLRFSRNFGHQCAVSAGLAEVSGDAVVVMDSDLQDPPEVALELIKAWENGADVAYAQRHSRKDKALKKLTASVYYRVLDFLSDVKIPRDTGDFRLMSREVVDVLNSYPEHNRYLRGIVASLGFNQVAVEFDRDERHNGASGYTLKKMLKLASDGIFGFSSVPLKIASRIGALFAALSVLAMVYALGVKIFTPTAVVPGWTFIVISIFLVSAVQLMILGVMGDYIGRIFTEVRGRPLYIISERSVSK